MCARTRVLGLTARCLTRTALRSETDKAARRRSEWIAALILTTVLLYVSVRLVKHWRDQEIVRGFLRQWGNAGERAVSPNPQRAYDAIRRGVDPNTCDERKATLLMWASEENDPEGVRLLLSHGADPNRATGDGMTPLRFAAGGASTGLIEELTARGALVDSTDAAGTTPLMQAAQSGQSANMQVLIRRGADVRLTNRSGESALTFAARAGNAECTRVVIREASRRGLGYLPDTQAAIEVVSRRLRSFKRQRDQVMVVRYGGVLELLLAR